LSAIRRVLLRLVSFFRSGNAEADLAREIKAHLQLLEDRFIAQGMSAQDAHYAARRAFGGVEQVKEYQRDERSFRWLAGWSMDLKLGARMLIKYPGLALVGGLAISFAIAAGAGTFEFLTQLVHPTLLLDDGDRIVGIRLWDTASSSVEEQAAYDFARWREELESIEDLGAFRTLERNLTTESGLPEPVQVAEISASAFRVARVPPLKGRFLVAADEQVRSPAVVVIGYDVWQTRLGGDPDVVGRAVRLGSAQSTVVGVMPERFAFPVSHSVWAPLRLDLSGPRQGPEIQVFGRLAPGVTLDRAQAELTSIGMRAATDFPDTHEHVRPEVMPYAQSITGVRGLESVALLSINAFLLMLLILVGANVALLMFARAAARESEMVVRNALGATRGRIIMQLFAEALVLGTVAAAAGLDAASFLLKWWLGVSEIDAGGRLPFWFDASIAPETMFYAACLTVLAASVAGVVPAIKVTGRRVEARLRQAAVGSTGLRFGGVWTVAIVTQVAVTVAFPATAFFVRRNVVQMQSLDVGFPAAEYLSARLEMDPEIAAPGASAEAARAERLARFRTAWDALEQRLASEPGVAGVTFTDRLPRTVHAARWLDVDGEAAPPESARGHRVNTASVALNYFDVLGAPVLSGRAFHSGDLEAGARVVIVNQSFVNRVLRDRNPIGRRVRYVTRNPDETESATAGQGSWHTIVGVVRDLGTIHDNPRDLAGLYHPSVPGAAFPVHITVHVRGEPGSFAPRLRTVAAAVDPTLRLHELRPLNQVGASMWNEFEFLFRLLVFVSLIALLLSLAGIYSVMSFTVSRRTREIGIRVALGAAPPRVVAAIFSRPLAQVAVGVAAGGGLVFVLTRLVTGLSLREVALVVAYMTLMMGVCLLACIVPTQRALRIQPTEAPRTAD
jgi:putative ABC transport system permease protein